MSPAACSTLNRSLRQKMHLADQNIGLHLIKLISFLNRNGMGMKNLRSSNLAFCLKNCLLRGKNLLQSYLRQINKFV